MEDTIDKIRNYINALQRNRAESEELDSLFADDYDNLFLSDPDIGDNDTDTEEIFTDNWNNDTLFTSEFGVKGEHEMTLYAYMDKQAANNLFKFYVGAWYNNTKEYRSRNPLNMPLTLYETAGIARLMAIPQNTQLVAFNINTGRNQVYDHFDIYLQINLKQSKIAVDDYKSEAVAWRVKKQYKGYDYIEYIIRDKNIVTSIQLQDTK